MFSSYVGLVTMVRSHNKLHFTDRHLKYFAGGDGLVAARHLAQYGYNPSVYYPKQGKNELYQVRILTIQSPLSKPPWNIYQQQHIDKTPPAPQNPTGKSLSTIHNGFRNRAQENQFLSRRDLRVFIRRASACPIRRDHFSNREIDCASFERRCPQLMGYPKRAT